MEWISSVCHDLFSHESVNAGSISKSWAHSPSFDDIATFILIWDWNDAVLFLNNLLDVILLDSKDVVEFKELLMANTIQVDTMYQLLIQKGYLTEAEFLAKMKEV